MILFFKAGIMVKVEGSLSLNPMPTVSLSTLLCTCDIAWVEPLWTGANTVVFILKVYDIDVFADMQLGLSSIMCTLSIETIIINIGTHTQYTVI